MRLLVILFIMLLSGCSMFSQDKTPEIQRSETERTALWQQHQAQLQTVQDWQLSGKLGIRTSKQSSSLYIKWQQQQVDYHIRISSVIGQSLAILQGDRYGVSLSTADNETLYAASPEQLLLEKLGWQFPVSNLQYWIKGIPAPGSSQPQLNNQGLLEQLQQGEWSLTFSRYQHIGEFQLPGKVIAKSPHARLTFIINNWTPDS